MLFRSSVNELYYEDNADCVFLDNSGKRIVSPVTSTISSLNAAVYLEAGRTYHPAITAWYDEENYGINDPRDDRRETGESKGGGGCNYGFGVMSAAILALFLKRKGSKTGH